MITCFWMPGLAHRQAVINKPFFLAGGISASNARRAIEITHPYALDASSGMETDGYKDFGKMKEFIDTVRSLE